MLSFFIFFPNGLSPPCMEPGLTEAVRAIYFAMSPPLCMWISPAAETGGLCPPMFWLLMLVVRELAFGEAEGW
jgi:hypothetical protein